MEHRTVQESLRATQRSVPIEFSANLALRRDALFDVLQAERPAVVHFAGNGLEDGNLVLEGEDGRGALLSGDAFARMISLINQPSPTRPIRCVVLNACGSGALARAVSRSVDIVIGINGLVADQAAVAFAGGFYRALAVGQTASEALEQGRMEARLRYADEPDQAHYDPALFTLHAREGVRPESYVLAGAVS